MKRHNNKRTEFNVEIYDFIIKYFKRNMLVPTIREIVNGTSYVSSGAVHPHMRRLLDAGKLNKIGDRFCLPKKTVIQIIKELEAGE